MRLCIDAGPLENEHRFRGIGSCTASLLASLTPTLLEQGGVELQYLSREPHPDALGADGQFAPRSPIIDWVGNSGRLPRALTLRWTAFAGGLRLAADVQRAGADVFLATDPNAVPRSRRFRTVAMLYDLIPLRLPEEYLPRRARIGRANYAWQLHRLRSADHLIAISDSTRRDAMELLGIEDRRISVVHLAVDRALFRPLGEEAARTAVRERFGVERPYFLYVGGVDARKNVARLVQAFEQAMDQFDAVLVMAGEPGPRGEQLRQRLEGSRAGSRIQWTGYVADHELPVLYSGALALVYPSLYEGFGLPALEAMSCGAPVITYALSSLPEVVGDAALLADPGSAADLAAALQKVAAEPGFRSELRDRGLERARHFSWESTATGILEACRAVHQGRA